MDWKGAENAARARNEMKKTVYIVGAGMGAGDMTQAGMDAALSAEVLFGAPRLLEIFGWEAPAFLGGASGFAREAPDFPETPPTRRHKAVFPFYRPEDVAREIERSEKRGFAVLVSGDVGFFSAAAGLRETLKNFDSRVLPGVSCVNAFAAKLGIPWQDFQFVSMHGAGANIADQVRRHRRVFCLTGGNAAEIGRKLTGRGLGEVNVFVAENLGSETEKIAKMTAKALGEAEIGSLATLLIVNENFDGRVRFGLPDDAFTRLRGVPMTKSEVRAVIASKLNLFPNAVCYDIGAGTGSVTVEMALAAYDGHVFAVERNETAAPLIEENLTRFHVGNVTVVPGSAPVALEGLPPPDAAFIGGSSGEMSRIIETLVKKNAAVKIVASAITLESAVAARVALENAFPNAEMLQLSVSVAKAAGDTRRLEARNPIFILNGGGLTLNGGAL